MTTILSNKIFFWFSLLFNNRTVIQQFKQFNVSITLKLFFLPGIFNYKNITGYTALFIIQIPTPKNYWTILTHYYNISPLKHKLFLTTLYF